MSVHVTDNSRKFRDAYREASRQATDAAAALYEGNIKRRMMRGYYTSRKFRSTAQIVQHVQRSKPRWVNGQWESLVGIPKGIKPRQSDGASSYSVGEIALAWELGHQNLFTRKYERVEIFKPVLMESKERIAAVYAKTLARILRQKGAK